MRLDPDWTGLWLAKVDARPVASMTQTACRSQTTAATKGGGKGPGWGKGGLRQAAGQAWLNHLTVFTMFQLFPFRQDRAEGMKQRQNVRFVFLKITWRGSAVFYSHSHLRCRQQSPIVYTCWAGSSRGKLDETCAQRESVINVQCYIYFVNDEKTGWLSVDDIRAMFVFHRSLKCGVWVRRVSCG